MSGKDESATGPSVMLERGAQLSRLVDTLGVDRDVPLGAKAGRIVDGIIDIWHGNGGHFNRSDAETIQDLVLAELTPAEFKDIAKLSFANWVTPARLDGPGLPHLNRLNESLGRKVADLAAAGGKAEIQVLDLGAGLLSTTERIAQAVQSQDIRLDVIAIDATPALVAAAQPRRELLVQQYPSLTVDLRQSEMLSYLRRAPDQSVDFVAISFAIHHLHPTEQTELISEALRALWPGGAFLVADPQEGKSDFNLKVLIYEEPEAIFAAFTAPDSMGATLAVMGFDPVGVLMRDDEGYEGYSMYGEKPAVAASPGGDLE